MSEKSIDECLEQIFVISTGHVTKEDAKALDKADFDYELVVHDYDSYGWIIVMPEDLTEAQSKVGNVLSDAFWNILSYVRSNCPDCTRVQFDTDGAIKDEFITFDW